MILSLPLIASAFTAMFASFISANDDHAKTITYHEGLVTLDSNSFRAFNVEDDAILNKCMVHTFNEIHDIQVSELKNVALDPEGPYAAFSHMLPKTEVALGETPRRSYTSFRWRIFTLAACRTCPSDCANLPNDWLCQHPDEANLLSNAKHARLREANRHREWEASFCDCLVQSGEKALAGVSRCKVSFSPLGDNITFAPRNHQNEETKIDDKKRAKMVTRLDDITDDFPGDITLVSHQTVVLFNSLVGSELTENEDLFLNKCLLDTFNSLQISSGTKAKSVVTVADSQIMAFQETLPEVRNAIQADALRTSTTIRWKMILLAVCSQCPSDCDRDLPGNWLCENPAEAKLLSDAERFRLQMSLHHQMWELALCSCLIGGEMEGFNGVQNCKITFPPSQERNLLMDTPVFPAE